MIRFLFVCLALAGLPQQDPPLPPVEEAFKGTPLGYTVEITDYAAVCEFFSYLSNSIIARSQVPEFLLAKTAAEMGLSDNTEAWQCILEANPRINKIAGRTIPSQEQVALAREPDRYRKEMRAFKRQQVLDLREEFLRFRADFEAADGDTQALMAYIRDWAAKHVSIRSDKPQDHPEVQEFLAVEALFDDAVAARGGSK